MWETDVNVRVNGVWKIIVAVESCAELVNLIDSVNAVVFTVVVLANDVCVAASDWVAAV
jgi:hypothetical protein